MAPTGGPGAAPAGGGGAAADGQAAAAGGAAGAPARSHDTPHPPYMLIWGILAVLMLGKVGVALIEVPKWVSVGILVLLSLVSALLVALYYMHLRFEPKRLWILAAIPIPLAIIFILSVMTEFR